MTDEVTLERLGIADPGADVDEAVESVRGKLPPRVGTPARVVGDRPPAERRREEPHGVDDRRSRVHERRELAGGMQGIDVRVLPVHLLDLREVDMPEALARPADRISGGNLLSFLDSPERV